MKEAGAQSEGSKAPDALAVLFNDENLVRIFAALDREGEETRIVGGALRNALFDRPVHEVDLATTLVPDAIIAQAKAAGLRAIPTGLAHGTVTLLAGDKTYEVTSLREDIATDGRHATVRFGRDFKADAMRRDFTVNALSMTRDGRLFDYTQGLADIAAKKIRFIGDPAQRIAEDYLRILRFYRFSADFGEGSLDFAGHQAALRLREGLDRLSRERVRAELLKLFCAQRAPEIITEMCADGLLGPLLASAPNPARFNRVVAIAAGVPQDPLLRVAALCLHLSEDAERLRERLRLSNAEHERLERAATVLMELHGIEAPPEPDKLRVLLFLHGRQAALDAITLSQADASPGHEGEWQSARQFLQTTPVPELPFSGADLLARGVPEGRAIGEALKDLRARWIAEGFPEEPARLAKLLDETLRATT